jgi:hypothetical protein
MGQACRLLRPQRVGRTADHLRHLSAETSPVSSRSLAAEECRSWVSAMRLGSTGFGMGNSSNIVSVEDRAHAGGLSLSLGHHSPSLTHQSSNGEPIVT